MATDGRAAAHIDNVKALPKRETIKVPLTAALVKSLDFHQWPVSPLQWDGSRLVTEPTPPHVKDWIVRDSVTRGLGVRVTSGAKSYFVQRKRKGSTSDRYVLTQQQNLQDARIQAAAWYAVMAEGKNPTQTIRDRAQAEADVRAAKSFTFGLAFAAYVEDGESRVTNLTLRPASLKDRKAVVKWMEASELWSAPLADVDTATVKNTFETLFASAERARRERRLRDDEGPRKRGGLASDVAAVHKVLTYCKACWTWTAGQKVAVNPFAAWAKGTKLPKVGRRQSVLPMETEAGAVWLRELVGLRGAEDPAMSVRASYVLLAVLWGGRRSELAEIRWDDVNFAENWVLFAAETTKANRDHYVPLTPWAADLLKERREKNAAAGWPTKRGDRVFPYPTTKTGKIEDYRPVTEFLEEKSGLRISLHDLRRTLATSVFGSAGDLGTVSIALGHSSRQDVTAGYVQRQAALAALRNLYDAREKLLRQLIGLDAAPQSSVLSDFQKSMIQTVQTLLRQAGLHELAPHDLAALLAEQ